MLKLIARIAVLPVAASAVVLGAGSPAHGGAGDTAEGQACGASSFCVSVKYTGTAAPSGGDGGGGGGYVASVPYTCYWKPWLDPEAALKFMEDAYGAPAYSGKEWVLGYGKLQDFQAAAAENPTSTWYRLECPGLEPGDWDGMAEYAGKAAKGNGWTIPQMTRLIRPDEDPPAPVVDVELLRDAAYDSMDIPEPDVQRNPRVRDTGATLVNIDTMFWADDYRDEYWIQASVGKVWARVTANAQDFVLSSPAGGQTCTHEQFVTPYAGGDAPAGACAFPFSRASVGIDGGFPVTTTVTWQASWTSSETPDQQPLPPVSTDTSLNVPVNESQAIVDDVG